jgi:hypothetical protein
MTTFAVLASGPSMTQEDADYVRGTCRVLAVSNAYQLAPWAEALVSHDMRWWRKYDDAFKFSGRKFCRFNVGVEVFNPPFLPPCCNSGLMGMYVAQHIFGATKILMLGFDMHGTHFFGPHVVDEKDTPDKRLKNTTEARRATFIKQFAGWKGCNVINCTAGSTIKNFEFKPLREVI